MRGSLSAGARRCRQDRRRRVSVSRVPSRRRFPTFLDPAGRRLLILALYGYQGLVAGFGMTALPNHFAELGATVGAIGGYMAMVGLPWALQPLWGPLVDRFGRARMGRRRFWVVLALAGALASLACLPLAGDGPAALARLGPLLLLHSGFAALLDTAVDAMIIDRVPVERLGQATALTRTGFVTGTAVGAVVFAWMIPAHGLATAALLLLLLGTAAMVVALLVREANGDPVLSLRHDAARAEPVDSYRVLLLRLFSAMRQPAALALLALCIAEEAATAVLGVHLGVEMIQRGGWDAVSLSRLQGALALLGGTAGALLIGHWSDRVGHYRVLRWLLAGCAAAYAAAAGMLMVPQAAWLSAGALALSSIVPALAFVALAPAVMRSSRGIGAATRFALFMAALNLGGILGSATSGLVGTLLSSWQIALGGACIFAACAAAARRPERLFGPDADDTKSKPI
ncbi:MAG: MFS transporter [Acetobacteraceae bacterium]|nr:MAG: MFS transporter [Acetobacteraceae bacterium]